MNAILINFAELTVKVIPILAAAVFLAEAARLRLGEERLKRLLVGPRPWSGRLRAAFLGALLPFCECGAFPLMVALLRAGVPLKTALTFFLISPIVSLPAFLFLTALYGPVVASAYLIITVSLGLAASTLLAAWTNESETIRRVFRTNPPADGDNCRTTTSCETGLCEELQSGVRRSGAASFLSKLWSGAGRTFLHLLPYAVPALFIAALLQSVVPDTLIERVFDTAAPFDVPIAAAAGVPIYAGDCTMFSIVAPFIEVTGAVGPGMAFIIAGAGTSINGLVFMAAIFHRRFLAVFVLSIFSIALIAGYILGLLF